MSIGPQPKVHALFATPLIELAVPDFAALNESLKASILSRQVLDAGMQRSNILGWHSKEDLLQWGGEAAKTLAITTIETCSAYTADQGMQEGKPRFSWNIQMWANVSPAGASNQFHAHAGAFWSAVYYVDDGGDTEQGRLLLQDPRFPMNKMSQPDMAIVHPEHGPDQTIIKVKPEPGKLVCFPSWLSHAVEPHQGARPRVSIAMNLVAVPVMGE